MAQVIKYGARNLFPRNDKLAAGIKPGDSVPFKKTFKKIVFISVVLSLVPIILVFTFQKNLPPQVPLFYGLAQGEEQLAGPTLLVIPSLISAAILLANSLLAYFWRKEFLQEALVFTGFAVSTLSAITTLKIILLVGSF